MMNLLITMSQISADPAGNVCSFGLLMLEAKFTDVRKGHFGQENRNAHETDDQQGNSGSHSKQCTLKRLGSVRVTQNDEDASFNISFFLDFGSEQYCASTSANEIIGSVTLHCPTTAANEITGSVALKQASLAMDNEAYDLSFANNDDSVPQLGQEQPVLVQQKHDGDCVQVRPGMEDLLVSWDPSDNGGDYSSVSPWRQVEIQGGRNVTYWSAFAGLAVGHGPCSQVVIQRVGDQQQLGQGRTTARQHRLSFLPTVLLPP